jgi:hypothetical protein
MEEATQQPSQPTPRKSKDVHGGIVGGLILIGIGGIFLLDSLDLLDMDITWPLILIVVGSAILVGSVVKKS